MILQQFIPEDVSFSKRPRALPAPGLTLRDTAPFGHSKLSKHTPLMIMHQLNESLYHAVQDRKHFELS